MSVVNHYCCEYYRELNLECPTHPGPDFKVSGMEADLHLLERCIEYTLKHHNGFSTANEKRVWDLLAVVRTAKGRKL